MGKRLLLFILFLSLSAVLISFKEYQKHLDNDESFMTAMTKPKEVKVEKKKVVVADDGVKKINIDTPGYKKGMIVYTEKGQCLKCHGANGEGNVSEEAPLIAAQYDWYIIDQVTQMKSGQRVNEKMMPYLSELTEEDIQNVAEYVSKLRIK